MKLMKRRGFEIAISTIVLLVIGIAVLIALFLLVREGIISFGRGTDPLLRSSAVSGFREACNIACNAEDKLTFCCQELTVDELTLKCFDSRLEVDCALDCSAVSCD